MKTDKKKSKEKNSKIETLQLLILGIAIFFIVLLPLKNFGAIIKLTLSYLFFIYLPFLPLVESIRNISIVEKFLLNNAAGLSYAGIYVVLDVIFKIPLTKFLYFFVTLVIIAVSWTIYLKRSKNI